MKQTEAKFQEIKDYIEEIEACRNQEEFAFILVIAQSDVLDNYANALKKLESKVMRLQKILKK